VTSPTPTHKPVPKRAMLLAAGLATRLKHLRQNGPKALLSVGGRTLLDHALDKLEEAGVEEVMINLHYKGDMIRDHLAKSRKNGLKLSFSDESDLLMDTGGGVAKALDFFGDEPFYVVNAKQIWTNGYLNTLQRLADAWNGERMDALLLLVATVSAIGYDGIGDFDMDADGRVTRRKEGKVAPFVYALQIVHPRLFKGCPKGPFSFNILWDKAEEACRLYGIRHDGTWIHVGTPGQLVDAEAALQDQ
jgi:N-acetyl-alpha-D-muramate 1-phosphate uridylyltransferase